MNLKKELQDVGYFLITPYPAKYHFEGVNNRRASIVLTGLTIALNAVVIVGVSQAPELIEKFQSSKIARKFKKNPKD